MSTPFEVPLFLDNSYPVDPAIAGPHQVAQVGAATFVKGVLTSNVSSPLIQPVPSECPGYDEDEVGAGHVYFSSPGPTGGGNFFEQADEPQVGDRTYIGWVGESGWISSSRGAPGGGCLAFHPDGYLYQVTTNTFSGSQSILFEPYSAFEVHGDTSMVVVGSTVDFAITSDDFPLDSHIFWWFLPGDTSEVAHYDPYALVGTCSAGGPTCQMQLTESGRMYARTVLGGTALTGRLSSDIVWVRDSIPATCGTPQEPQPGPGEGPLCPPPTDLSLTCSPSLTIRATDAVNCVPTAPPGSTMTVTGWRFVGGENGEFEIAEMTSAPATWDGLMLVSGTVTVYADWDGVPDSASTTIQVDPRSWPAAPLNTSVMDTIDSSDPLWDLPNDPAEAKDIGQTQFRYIRDPAYLELGTIDSVTSGPNRSLLYNAAPAFTEMDTWTEINTDALTNPSNPFYDRHPEKGGGQTCNQQKLEDVVRPAVIEHEGYHFDYGYDWFGLPVNDYNVMAEEIVVIREGPDPVQLVADATLGRALNALVEFHQANQVYVHSVYPPDHGCNLLYGTN